MAVSDAILQRLLKLHPKIIDLNLDRMWRLLARLDHPERKLPPVVHVAGTNGKGSTIAYMRSIMEASSLNVHVYTSPHLVKFHERVRLAGCSGNGSQLIDEAYLSELLEECEAMNDGEPITFFEITTAAAILAFSRCPADYLLLEVGLGGRLDATNVIDQPAASVITSIAIDHQQYLGETIAEIAGEKAGILKPGVVGIIAPQQDDVRAVLEAKAAAIKAPLMIGGQDWQAYEQHGRLVYEDDDGLLDLPLPGLLGRFQIDNAGTAIATLRQLGEQCFDNRSVAAGLQAVSWSARLEKLTNGRLSEIGGPGVELWLDGGHNGAAGSALAESFADLHDRMPVPLTLIAGMLNTKAAVDYLRPFIGLAVRVIAIAIPDEENSFSAQELADMAKSLGFEVVVAASIIDAVEKAAVNAAPGRVLIGGSLYLAGHVLALHKDQAVSTVSGSSKKS